MKVCNSCNRTLELSKYTKDKRNKDGLQGDCNDCRSEKKKQYRDKIRQGIGYRQVSDKLCNTCDITKPIDEFFKDSSNSDGHARRCKDCKNASVKAWRHNKSEEYNAYMRQYRKEHPQSLLDKEKSKNRTRKSRYGISNDNYHALLELQGGICAICKKLPKSGRSLVVDHSHANGMTRGLLCDRCNVAIAILDNVELLSAAMEYLK